MPFTLARARFATGEPGRDRGAIRCHVPGEMFFGARPTRLSTLPVLTLRALLRLEEPKTVRTPDPGRPLSFVDTEARVHLRCSWSHNELSLTA